MRRHYSAALAGAVALAATAGPAIAADIVYSSTYIPVTPSAVNVQPGLAFSSFDISFADPVTGDVYIADRSNAAVDIFSTTSLIGRAGGTPTDHFTGQGATTSVSGADGVLTVTSGNVTTIYGGDGNSTLRVYNATTANPGVATFQAAISTGGATRVDEMAFSPSSNQVLAANNAETPAYGNLFSTTGGHTPVTLTTTPGVGIQVPASQGGISGGGMEQPAWNPTTGTFFVSIPQLGVDPTPIPPNPQIGGVSEIDTSGNVLRTINFKSLGITSCSPTGLAVSTSGNMLVGCGNVGTQAVLLDKNGNLLKLVGQGSLGGTDEIWYDPRTNAFYVTGNDGTNTGRFFDLVSDNGTVVETVDLPATASAHSITVDPLNGDVFVALAGTSALNPSGCAAEGSLGCIEVFTPAPEPGSLPLLAVGLAGLMGLAVRRRLQ
jgi:hypothetical protein